MVGPCFHQFAALLYRVATSVSLFGFISYDMGERSFGEFAREVCRVASPIPEAASEAVNGDVLQLHAPKHHFHRHIGKRLVPYLAWEDKFPQFDFLKFLEDRNRPR